MATKNKAPTIKILTIRDQKVVLDVDLAGVYGVSTRVLNQAVRRNKRRFPVDFAFRLSSAEYEAIRSQIVIASSGTKDVRSQTATGLSRRHAVANCDWIKAEHPLQALGIYRTRRITSSKHFA